MNPLVFTAVLAAAGMHAGWNVMIRAEADRFGSIVRLSLVAGIAGLLLIPFAPPPASAAWGWLAASIPVHVAYNLFLIRAYGHGDLGQVYPIARGVAPLVVALLGAVWLNERLTPESLAAVILIALGVVILSRAMGSGRKRMTWPALAYALAAAACIAGVTLVNGAGARAANTVVGYAAWLFAIDGAAMVTVLLLARGRGALQASSAEWRRGLAAGALSMGCYSVALWAFTQAPLAMVAALRETSVFFAVLLAALVLKERLTAVKLTGAALIMAGAAALRLV